MTEHAQRRLTEAPPPPPGSCILKLVFLHLSGSYSKGIANTTRFEMDSVRIVPIVLDYGG